jgi:predicted nucleotidyltransferase
MNNFLIISFGSRINGRTNTNSDYDFGVLGNTILTLEERTSIAYHLSKELNINEDKIDLVDLSNASPLLKFEVAKKGKLVQGKTFDFIRFKVRAMKEYQDTAKFRRMRERLILQPHVA